MQINIPQTATTISVFSTLQMVSTRLLSFELTTQEELKRVVMSSKTTHCAQDPLPTKLLKDCLNVLLPVMTKIVNLSLSEGEMPLSLKKALVIPLLKKLNLLLEMLKNYRPVSNLTFLSKIIEKIVAIRLKSHMDINELHELLQSAYKEFHSCETALIKVQDDILRAVDRGQCVLLVLLDLSAAFDTIDHSTLLKLLSERFGIGGTALKWFNSYLSNRSQSVIIDGTESDVWNILFGVPQGSVLGPVLFTIYTSPLGDILRHHNVSYHLYADDTQIYLSFDFTRIAEAITKVETCIMDIRQWMATNFLRLNDDKTEFIIIGSECNLKKVPLSFLSVGKDRIDPAKSVRNIGAYFDYTLSMNDHISHISKNAWFQLRQISHIRPYLDKQAAVTLMHSFVSSRLDSFNSLLFGIPQYQVKKLQRIQNAAARIVSCVKKFDHVTPVLYELHWLPIEQRIKYKILLLTYKSLNDKAPIYLKELLTIRTNTSRNLRSNDKLLLNVPRCKLQTFGCKSFSFAAPSLWNKLPEHVRKSDSIDIFKVRLKTFLFREAFVQ